MVLLIIIETAPSISKTRPHRTTIISMRKLLYLSVRFLRISTRHAMDMIIKKTEADSNDTLYSFISDAIIHARDHRHSQQRNPPSHNYMIFPVKIPFMRICSVRQSVQYRSAYQFRLYICVSPSGDGHFRSVRLRMSVRSSSVRTHPRGQEA